MQDSHASAMVDMVVGDQHGIDALRIPAMNGKSFLDLDAADPGVEQELNAIGLDVDAVAVAAGLEGNDLHGSYCTARS